MMTEIDRLKRIEMRTIKMRRKLVVVILGLAMTITFAASSVSAEDATPAATDHKKTEDCGSR